jgi:hypothetical protein
LSPTHYGLGIALPIDPDQGDLLLGQPSHDVEGQAAAAVYDNNP